MDSSSGSRWDSEVRLLAWLALCVSVFSFLYYSRLGDLLLYGDAVAHTNIARRVFDSKTPGLLQLGTVWLPLPHLLILPFVISNSMWQSGVGGSIPSLAAYVFGVLGIFRLLRGTLARGGENEIATRAGAWIGALAYGANPNLVYLQTTAMGEALYLCFFVWAVVFFSEFVQGDSKARARCGWCLLAACLTRYDGWFLATVMIVGVLLVSFRRENRETHQPSGAQNSISVPRVALVKFFLIAAAGPALWLGYNAAVYRNPLEFANGPYSPKAIEQKTRTVNPAKGNLYAATSYFLKSAELNVAESPLEGRLWLLLAALGSAGILLFTRWAWPILFLWVPLPFYTVSIAYGGVPIFVPTWWPFSLYNVRYGLQLLPALSAMLATLIYVVTKESRRPGPRILTTLAVIAIVLAGYASVWQAQPICLHEAQVNSRNRIALEKQLATWLKKLPPNSTLLMYLGEHPGAVQQAGIPLKRVINEGNHRVWKQPSDPEGLWERALATPERFADYVVAFEGDPVWSATHGRGLKELVEIEVTGQPRAVLFRAR